MRLSFRLRRHARSPRPGAPAPCRNLPFAAPARKRDLGTFAHSPSYPVKGYLCVTPPRAARTGARNTPDQGHRGANRRRRSRSLAASRAGIGRFRAGETRFRGP
ncbi:hypothetical protein Lokhon_00046 (plasmid) [Limimaricola hongkongensis DSM 17492]|uniref:Uncharacterized protein n=1 Tax=Limimaricola hongkongensis DSM 17492 TaxID=1122180 RepID=A0A017H9K5_9RHOB|nr:hypothetical protein Lokhon_00046 [Limimaricola hongkongensis DSM 17492]